MYVERKESFMGTGGGGEAVAAEENVGSIKRMRRPSVRLHQPYDEKPGNFMSRKQPQQQREPIKEDVGVKKTRQVKTTVSKTKKNSIVNVNGSSNEEDDDDVVIGSWKNICTANRERNFKSKARRKRIRSSNSNKWVSVKSRENEVKENENFRLTGEGEREKEGEGEEEEKDLGNDEIHMNFEHENSNPSGPYHSFDDNVNNRVSGDCEDVGVDGRTRLRVARDSTEMEGAVGRGEIDRDRDGIRVWLNQLGLGKYAILFDVHEVDDEILPLLTLEDLKDMGINAVGSRRKMYSSIQKLGKGFS